MKHFLIKIFLLLCLCSNAQVHQKSELSERNSIPNQIMSGSCGSPDGTALIISSAPSGYVWLNSNGYCYAITATENFTMCFTFTSIGTDISINSGYSTLGCFGETFSGFDLYTCNPSCTFVGSALSFSGLTAGQCYTWCFSGTCFGPGPGFQEICPYWINTTPLPIDLISFLGIKQGNNNALLWSTKTEQNNKEFLLYKSLDGSNWNKLASIHGAGTTEETQKYSYTDNSTTNGINYYRLSQVDYNGNETFLGILVLNNNLTKLLTLLKMTDILGRQLSEDNSYTGVVISYWNDGSITKSIKTE